MVEGGGVSGNASGGGGGIVGGEDFRGGKNVGGAFGGGLEGTYREQMAFDSFCLVDSKKYFYIFLIFFLHNLFFS